MRILIIEDISRWGRLEADKILVLDCESVFFGGGFELCRSFTSRNWISEMVGDFHYVHGTDQPLFMSLEM